MNSEDAEAIRNALDDLNQVLQQVGAAAYQQPGPQAGSAWSRRSVQVRSPALRTAKMWLTASFTAPDLRLKHDTSYL